MAVKPTIPSGTRDFSPEEVYKRQYIFNTIRSVFEKYGYQPIETPTMENLSTLEGKYGEEGDRLLFRILDSGKYLEEIEKNPLAKKLFDDIRIREEELRTAEPKEDLDINVNKAQLFSRRKLLEGITSKELTQLIAEKGLRYDLTVPFARYVVMHQNEISFPFKRYQIQSVFRADRPQKGRYREFFQCDADVVGSDSLLNEVELIQIYNEVFAALKIGVTIQLNNRKILAGIAEGIGAPEKTLDIAIAIDKFDKIGVDGVVAELKAKGFNREQVSAIYEVILMQFNRIVYSDKAQIGDSNLNKLNFLKHHPDFESLQILQEGIHEAETILNNLKLVNPELSLIVFDITLARGLNYYTGAIIEVKPNDVKMGSVGGGGRYDDLTGVFGLKGVSGVGISFGADRIYDVMEELKLFPAAASQGTQVLFCYFDEASQKYCLPLVKRVRDEGIAAEMYPSAEKMKKQLKYANDKKIPFVIVVGDNEMQSGKLAFKDMESGEQKEFTMDEIIEQLK